MDREIDENGWIIPVAWSTRRLSRVTRLHRDAAYLRRLYRFAILRWSRARTVNASERYWHAITQLQTLQSHVTVR